MVESKTMWWRKQRAYLDVASGRSANPSSPHEEGRKSRERLERARKEIARLLEVQGDDVVFTSGATEANALAILGVLKPGDHAFYLPSAHASIVENMKLAETRGIKIQELPLVGARVDCEVLEKMIRPETRLVTMEAVCGETGVIWNTREVAQVLRAHSRTAVLHVDASQAPLTEKITRAHFNADLLTLDASKVGEVRGIGALIAHRTIPITPLYGGGGQERGLRSGSEAPELAESFAVALHAAVKGREAFRNHAESERKHLIETLMQKVPNVHINEGSSQAPHILNLSLPGRDTDYLVALLDDAGYAVSTRSACETDSQVGSRAVFALTRDPDRALSTLRISWGPEISAYELRRFAEELERSVAFIDNGASR